VRADVVDLDDEEDLGEEVSGKGTGNDVEYEEAGMV
jgi:hypothetical protein